MKIALAAFCAGLALAISGTAFAHVSVTGPGTAGGTIAAKFGVGHGCEGADTMSIKVKLPAGITNVRPMHGGVFGAPKVDKEGDITTVTWTKAVADVLPADTSYYELTVRMKLPNTPWKTLYFPTTQTCGDGKGASVVSEWKGEGVEHMHDAPVADAGTPAAPEELPAPSLFLLPAHKTGWNKLTVTEHVHDLSVFDDAQIVWSGTAAYSSNATTAAMIASEPGTQVLSQIHPGTEIWVKY